MVNTVTVWRDGKAHVPPHLSKEQDIPLKAGDRVSVGTPGGGGFGNPFERASVLIERDVALGYYSEAQAEQLFGVTIVGGKVDETATRVLRSNLKSRAR
jgi:N-methylhydantoinase B